MLCCGIWGSLVSETANVKLPLMPVEHPLLFFGPWDALEGTGKDIVYPLFRDQGNSAYVRDTGDPTTPEGGPALRGSGIACIANVGRVTLISEQRVNDIFSGSFEGIPGAEEKQWMLDRHQR